MKRFKLLFKIYNLTTIYKQLTIKQKIFTLLVLFTSGFLVVSILSNQLTTAVVKKQYFAVSSQSLNLYSSLIGSELQEIDDLSLHLSLDNEVQRYLDSIKKSGSNSVVRFDSLRQNITSYMNYKNYIDTVHIIDSSNRETLFGARKIPLTKDELDYYSDISSKENGRAIWLTTSDNKHLLCIRTILSTNNFNFSHIGTLIVRVDRNLFLNETSTYLLDDKSPLLLVLHDNETIINTSLKDITSQNRHEEADYLPIIPTVINELIPKNVKQGYFISTIAEDKYFVSFLVDPSTSFTYLSLLPYGSITHVLRMVTILIVGLYSFLFITSFIIYRRASSNITKPIEELTSNMHLVKEGIYDLSKLTFSLYEANDEIKDMQDTFKTMLQKINYLITEIYEKQIIVEKTRFETLQAQINPHFLYNTLTSINALARSSNQKEISTMVISLSNLLRQSIDYRNDLITVREELSIVNDFLNIQQIRYPERIYMNINIDEPIKNLMIPKFSLQPLIENSIKYNISNKRGVCHITISSLIEDNNLTLSVTDNGIGMDPYYLYRENPQIDSERTGLGLKNIHERIKMLFDANYGLSIESANNKGTTIHVTIPVVEFNKEAQLV